jgi:hypothetical protein
MKRPQLTQYLFKRLSLIAMAGAFVLIPLGSMGMVSEDGERFFSLPDQKDVDQLTIEGEVTRVQGEFVGKDFTQARDRRYVVETPLGKKWALNLEETTLKTGDIFLGDQVKASIRQDGSLQTLQKIEQPNTQPNHDPVRRQIVGMVEKKNGNFLYVKQGDHTEILHMDSKSTLEGDIREGTNVLAQLGEAGYAIRVQEYLSQR